MGTGTQRDDAILTHETVRGSAGGITEVRGTHRMQPDGTYHVKTEHRKDGEWSPGRETTYHPAPDAQVLFK